MKPWKFYVRDGGTLVGFISLLCFLPYARRWILFACVLAFFIVWLLYGREQEDGE